MRFFFHVNGDKDLTEMASPAEAKCQAVKTAGALICDAASEFWDAASFLMLVTTQTGWSSIRSASWALNRRLLGHWTPTRLRLQSECPQWVGTSYCRVSISK